MHAGHQVLDLPLPALYTKADAFQSPKSLESDCLDPAGWEATDSMWIPSLVSKEIPCHVQLLGVPKCCRVIHFKYDTEPAANKFNFAGLGC